MVSKNKVYIEGYGYQKLYLALLTDINMYLARFIYNNEVYRGILSMDGKILVPFSTIPIKRCFKTNDDCDYCFTRYNKGETNYHSYHLSKKLGQFTLKADIEGKDGVSCRLVNTKKDGYWLIESNVNGINEVCLYDVKKAEILTPLFTDISFEDDDERVLAFVEKTLYNDEHYYLGSLLSFIDYDGKFVCPIYIPELDKNGLLYDSLLYNNDPNFKAFSTFCNIVKKKLEEIYNNKSDRVTEIMSNMFNDLYTIEEMQEKVKDTKILDFKKKRCSNETQ